MPWRQRERIRCAAILAPIPLVVSAQSASCQPDLGAEEIVKADGVAIDVPGYSVPSFVHWNADGLSDLVVGEGIGTDTPKVRVYLNEGKAGAPHFSSYFYAQSNGSDLTALGSG